jgi:hypothetical protein
MPAAHKHPMTSCKCHSCPGTVFVWCLPDRWTKAASRNSFLMPPVLGTVAVGLPPFFVWTAQACTAKFIFLPLLPEAQMPNMDGAAQSGTCYPLPSTARGGSPPPPPVFSGWLPLGAPPDVCMQALCQPKEGRPRSFSRQTQNWAGKDVGLNLNHLPC